MACEGFEDMRSCGSHEAGARMERGCVLVGVEVDIHTFVAAAM